MIQFLSKKVHNKKGFTLIELIVVIAILGILAAVVVPRVIGFTDTAKTSANVSNAKALYSAVALAASDGTITLANGDFTGIGSGSGLLNIGKFLDEWPKDQTVAPPIALEVRVFGTTIGVYQNSAATTPLAGATIAHTP